MTSGDLGSAQLVRLVRDAVASGRGRSLRESLGLSAEDVVAQGRGRFTRPELDAFEDGRRKPNGRAGAAFVSALADALATWFAAPVRDYEGAPVGPPRTPADLAARREWSETGAHEVSLGRTGAATVRLDGCVMSDVGPVSPDVFDQLVGERHLRQSGRLRARRPEPMRQYGNPWTREDLEAAEHGYRVAWDTARARADELEEAAEAAWLAAHVAPRDPDARSWTWSDGRPEPWLPSKAEAEDQEDSLPWPDEPDTRVGAGPGKRWYWAPDGPVTDEEDDEAWESFYRLPPGSAERWRELAGRADRLARLKERVAADIFAQAGPRQCSNPTECLEHTGPCCTAPAKGRGKRCSACAEHWRHSHTERPAELIHRRGVYAP